VDGWDDRAHADHLWLPAARLHAEAIRDFCERIGVAKAESWSITR